MRRSEAKNLPSSAVEGVALPGVGTVAPAEKKGFFRSRPALLRKSIDAAAGAGTIAIAYAHAKTGIPAYQIILEAGVLAGAAEGNLLMDAFDLYANSSPDQFVEKDAPNSTQIAEIGEVSVPPRKIRRWVESISKGIVYSTDYVGLSSLTWMTGSLLESRNLAGAAVAGGIELVLLNNIRRRKAISYQKVEEYKNSQ